MTSQEIWLRHWLQLPRRPRRYAVALARHSQCGVDVASHIQRGQRLACRDGVKRLVHRRRQDLRAAWPQWPRAANGRFAQRRPRWCSVRVDRRGRQAHRLARRLSSLEEHERDDHLSRLAPVGCRSVLHSMVGTETSVIFTGLSTNNRASHSCETWQSRRRQ